MKKIIKILLLISVIMSIYVTFIEPNLFIMKKYKLGNQTETTNEPFKVIQFTDTQLGDFYNLNQLEKVVNKINKENPDIVVFTGDLVDHAFEYEELDQVSEILSKIQSKSGKYAIWGNHDYGGGGNRYYADILKVSGFQLLVNETKIVEKNNQKYEIIGIDDGLYGEAEVDQILSKLEPANYNILLIHEPDLMDNYLSGSIDLGLAGHSHGGQVALPVIGAIAKVPLGKKYTKGFYDFENNRKSKLFVSSGLGSTKLPFRFLNIPEAVLFEIYP